MTQEIIKAEDYGLEPKQATDIVKGLSTILEERVVLVEAYKDVVSLEISQENLSTFKALRLQIRDNRTKGIEKWHKTNKAYFLTGGRFVDAIKNKEVAENERMESKLMEAEKHFENLEKERVDKLNSKRIELVRPYLEEVDHLHLADMEQDVFEAFLLTKKNNYEAIIKAEKEKELERIAKEKEELEKLEKQRLENIRLKKEAEAKEKALEKERLETEKKAEAIRKEQEIKAAKIKAENDAKIKVEQEAKEKLQAELKAKEDAEIKRIADNNARIIAEKKEAEATLQAQLNKGDADKVKDLISELEVLKTKYSFKSVNNKKMYNDTGLLIDKVINHIRK